MEIDHYERVYGLPEPSKEPLKYVRNLNDTQKFAFGHKMSGSDTWQWFDGVSFEHVFGIYRGIMSFNDYLDRIEGDTPYVEITVFLLLNVNGEPVEIINRVEIAPTELFDSIYPQERGKIFTDLSPSPYMIENRVYFEI